MRKFELKSGIGIVVTATLATMAIGCSGSSHQIIRMVDRLNSESMQDAERQTGLFTGSEAKIEGDTIVLSLHLVEELSLIGADMSQLPMLHQSAVDEFRAKMGDSEIAEGMNAMQAEGKVLKMQWIDSSGRSVEVVIDPSEVVR